MKRRQMVFALALAAITTVIASVYFRWPTMVLESRDTLNLRIEELHSQNTMRVRISGFCGHSALSVKNITTEREDSSIIVLVHIYPARKDTSGSFDYEVSVPDSVNEIRFGKNKVAIWRSNPSQADSRAAK